MFGITEALLIVGVGFVLFGAKAIPRLARSLGRARGEYERGRIDPDEAGARERTGPAAWGPGRNGPRR